MAAIESTRTGRFFSGYTCCGGNRVGTINLSRATLDDARIFDFLSAAPQPSPSPVSTNITHTSRSSSCHSSPRPPRHSASTSTARSQSSTTQTGPARLSSTSLRRPASMRLSGSPLLACKSHSARLPQRAARPSPRSLRWPTTPPCAPSRRRTQRRRRGESSPQRTGSSTCTGSRRLTARASTSSRPAVPRSKDTDPSIPTSTREGECSAVFVVSYSGTPLRTRHDAAVTHSQRRVHDAGPRAWLGQLSAQRLHAAVGGGGCSLAVVAAAEHQPWERAPRFATTTTVYHHLIYMPPPVHRTATVAATDWHTRGHGCGSCSQVTASSLLRIPLLEGERRLDGWNHD